MRGVSADMSAYKALAALLKASPEHRALFRRCCETSAERLCAQAWQFRAALREPGEWVGREDLEDALLTLARKVLPKTPAAQWDTEWAHELCKRAMIRPAALYGELTEEEQNAADLERAEAEWIERCNAAAEANDPAAFRAAVKGWEWALVETLEATRTSPGAA
jgi:hypothetical protein